LSIRVSLLALVLAGCASSAKPVAPTDARAPAELPAPSAAPSSTVAASPAPDEPAELAAPDPRAYSAATSFTAGEVKKVVRQHFDQVGACYQKGLARDPKMKGTIEVRLTIGDRGDVLGAIAKKDAPGRAPKAGGEHLTDHEVVTCVEGVFKSLTFAPTGQGLVNLVYPVDLRTE
jgi:hypothetical protein